MSLVRPSTDLRRIGSTAFHPTSAFLIIDATWDECENLVEQIGESGNCRVAFNGFEASDRRKSNAGRGN